MYDQVERTKRRLSIAVTSAFIAVIAAGRAHAQSAEAESLFSDGNKLMKQGDLARACDAFEASNRIEPRAGTLIRLGECREQSHQLASAWSAYKDALTRVKDRRKRALATARVAEIEPKLSYLTVSVPDDSRIDGLMITRNGQPLDPALWNRGIPVNGGEYVIGGRAPGHEEWATIVTVPNESGKVSVEVPKFKEITKLVTPPSPPERTPSTPSAAAPGIATLAGPPTAAPSPTAAARSSDPDEIGPSPSMWTTKRKVAIGLAGGSVAGLITGIVLSIEAKSSQNAAHALCVSPQTPCADADRANERIAEGQHRALGANLAYGAATAMAIGAGILWFTGTPEMQGHHVAIAPALAPQQPGVVVLGRF